MAIYADLPLQNALYEKLSNDAVLMGLITGIFDHVPQKSDFPYITIGEGQLADWSSHTFDGADAKITIHTWTRGGGRKKCKEVMSEIYRVLHNGSLSIDGLSLVLMRFEFGETMKDPDGQTYHGVQRFRILAGG